MFVPYSKMADGTLGGLVMSSFADAAGIRQMDEAHKNGGVEVKMTVDGREVDVAAFIKHWEDSLEQNIRRSVLAGIEDKVADINSALSQINELAKGVLKVSYDE